MFTFIQDLGDSPLASPELFVVRKRSAFYKSKKCL